jgi:pimeloyl-ACP methyl ester carboxylesterase
MTDFAFLHGGGQGSWVWDETIAEVERQSGGAARCLALDIPGCGLKRDRDTAQVGYPEIGPELIGDIEGAGMADVVLVGHSRAGSTLPLLAKLRPDLFRRLIYVTCQACPPGQTSAELMGNCRHGESETEVGWPVDPASASIEERLRAMFTNDMTSAQADAFMAKLGKDDWPALTHAHSEWEYDHLDPAISTYVLCDRDNSLTPPWQHRFAEQFHCGRIVHIDAGHQVMNTRPAELAGILLAEAG